MILSENSPRHGNMGRNIKKKIIADMMNLDMEVSGCLTSPLNLFSP